MNEKRLLSLGAAAQRAGVCKNTLHVAALAGHVTYAIVSIPNKDDMMVFAPEAVDRWTAGRKRKS
jgi:hypothetical protein